MEATIRRRILANALARSCDVSTFLFRGIPGDNRGHARLSLLSSKKKNLILLREYLFHSVLLRLLVEEWHGSRAR